MESWITILLFLPLPDPEVEKAIKDLGHPIFQVRAKASKNIEFFGLRAIKHLELAVKASHDVEVRKRCQIALNSYYTVMPKHYHKMPWIDRLQKCGYDYERTMDLRSKYLRKAGIRYESDYVDWSHYRAATELFIHDFVRTNAFLGFGKESAVKLLDEMVVSELEWWETYKNLRDSERTPR